MKKRLSFFKKASLPKWEGAKYAGGSRPSLYYNSYDLNETKASFSLYGALEINGTIASVKYLHAPINFDRLVVPNSDNYSLGIGRILKNKREKNIEMSNGVFP